MKIKHLHSIPKQALSSIAFFAGFLLFTGCVFDGLETPNGEGTASGQTIQVTIDMPDSTHKPVFHLKKRRVCGP